MCSNKGALNLIAQYGGDSSDDEVPGSRASTKRMYDDDDDETELSSLKRFERLPVPNMCLKEDFQEVTDNPELHEGRIRSFPHERGNWATYVYIPFEYNEALQVLTSHILFPSLKEIELKKIEELHISLSRTVILKHHWIDSFITTLRSKLQCFTPFIVMLDSLNVYCNEEKTRTFIGLQVKTGHDSLHKLVQCLNGSLLEFNLPTFYQNPAFHISLAWCLGDHKEELQRYLQDWNTHLHELFIEFSQENWYVYVTNIVCRTGNKLFHLALS